MIAERLDSAKIVFGLKGELAAAIDELSARSHIARSRRAVSRHIPDQQNERYSYIGDGIAMPHLRDRQSRRTRVAAWLVTRTGSSLTIIGSTSYAARHSGGAARRALAALAAHRFATSQQSSRTAASSDRPMKLSKSSPAPNSSQHCRPTSISPRNRLLSSSRPIWSTA